MRVFNATSRTRLYSFALFALATLFGSYQAAAQCLAGSLYPGATFTPVCPGASQTIVTDAWAGEYSNVNLLTTSTYTFTSSNPTDFITISDASGVTALASGTTPVVFTPVADGVYRFYIHLNAACGTQNSNRTRAMSCVASAVCSGTPNPGNTLSSEAIVCSNEVLTLSLQNSVSGTGISYQWYESTVSIGGPYNPVGSSQSTYSTNQTSLNAWYFCDVTCSNSGLTGSSLPVQVNLETNFNNCYCTAAATDLNAAFEKIDAVIMANVNNASDTAPPFTQGYQDFTGVTINVAQTASYPVTVSLINGWITDQTRIWIDYNQDGTFDNITELAFESAVTSADHTGTITIPGTAALGTTRMRVRMWDTNGGSYGPCGNHTYGQVEDYSVNITTPPSCLTPAIIGHTEDGATWATADVAFSDGGPGYQISYGPHPTAAGAGTVISGTASPMTITGLTNGLDYDVYIRQNCGGTDGDSDWSPAYMIHNYITVNTLGNEAYTTCGGILTDEGGILGDYSNFNSGYVVLTPSNATDVIHFTGTIDFEFGADAVYFFEGVGTAGTQIDGYTGTGTIDVLSVGAGVPVTVQIFSDAGGVAAGMNLSMACELAPTCTAPALVFANNVTQNSADISWNCVSCTGNYIIEYGPTGFTPGTDSNPGVDGTVVIENTTAATITGLTPGTSYDLYVRQNCGAGDYSTNSVFVVQFTTSSPPNCAASPVYTCGTNQSVNCVGNGAWNLTESQFFLNTAGQEKVFRFTPPTNGTYTLQVTSSDDFFAPLSYFWKEGSLGCDEFNWNWALTAYSFGVLPAQANIGPLTAGTEYYILVDAYSTSIFDNVTQNFNISCTPIVPPANDLCSGAISIGCGGTATGSTANASNDGEFDCGFSTQSSPGVWYSFQGDGGQYTVSLAGSSFDTKLSIYSGTCGSLVCEGYNDDAIGLQSEVSFTTSPGVEYLALVHGFGTNSGAYSINITCGPPPPAFDSPAGALNIVASGNAYPSCGIINGTTVGCSDSPEDFNTGVDCWYRFTAISSGVSIRFTSASMDDVIYLFESDAATIVDIEDTGIFGGDQEILNYVGLTPGATYYLCVGNYSEFFGSAGPFQICLRHLRQSTCDDGPGAYDLCSNFKADWTGAASYTFNFTNTNSLVTTTATSASQVPLSSAGLNLQHGESYDVTIDGTFNLFDGSGFPETLVVPGGTVCPISIAPHADLRTKAAQRCPATVLKGTTLQAKPFICAAINHTITFQEVSDCTGSIIVGAPFTTTTAGASSSKKLSQVGGVQAGKWYAVTWTPNFVYGPGTPGTTDIIYVAGAADGIVEEGTDLDTTEVAEISANLYPNPNDGSMVNINIANVKSDNVFVRIFDNTGRVVYTNRFTVDGSLNTIVTFDQALASGLYNVEFTVDGNVYTEKMSVQK